jgi:radical SAM protein with 4Fe4S-binding SPASM domain
MIALDPELRYRDDRVCYHPSTGYFIVSNFIIKFFKFCNAQPVNWIDIEGSTLASNIAKKLIKLGLAIDTNEQICTKCERPFWKPSSENYPPLDAEIYPTYNCNYSCKFCSSDFIKLKNNSESDLPREFIGEIAEKLDFVGLFNVGIVGGEPFLYPHLKELIDELIDKGMHVHLTTNASIEPSKIADVYQSGLHIAVSLHEDDPQKNDNITGQRGSYNRAVRSIKFLQSKDIPVRIISVIEYPSIEKIQKMAKSWIDLGVEQVTFCRAIKIGKARLLDIGNWSAESICELENMEAELNRMVKLKIHTGLPFRITTPPENQEAPYYLKINNRCDAGIRGLYIAPSCDVFPCELLSNHKYKLGNILDDDWPNFLVSSPIISFLRNLKTPESCNACRYSSVCHGGCPGLGIEDGDLLLPMLHCPFEI